MTNYDILFLGGFFPEELLAEIHENSKINMQNAADALQKSFITGLESLVEINKIFLISAPFIGAFPTRYNKPFIKATNYNTNGKSISFINILFAKHFFIKRNLKKAIQSWVKKKSGNKIIIIYSIQQDLLNAAIKVKQRNNNIKICQIVPDLPQFMGQPKGILHKINYKINRHLLNQYYSSIDCYVLLSKYMKNKLPINSKPFAIIEGIFNNENDFKNINLPKQKHIVYTGTLASRYGIVNLIKAFRQVDDSELRLVICGSGDAENYVKKASKEDKRIIFKGSVTREYALQIQKKALLLMNPRTPKGEFTKYSFPSKIMEYFASGTPTLMYKLPGIPSEYFDYCFTLDDNSINTLTNKIYEIININHEQLDLIGKKAQDFIFTKKNPVIQCKKIIDMIDDL